MTRRGAIFSAFIAAFGNNLRASQAESGLAFYNPPKPYLRVVLTDFARIEVVHEGETLTFTPAQIFQELK